MSTRNFFEVDYIDAEGEFDALGILFTGNPRQFFIQGSEGTKYGDILQLVEKEANNFSLRFPFINFYKELQNEELLEKGYDFWDWTTHRRFPRVPVV